MSLIGLCAALVLNPASWPSIQDDQNKPPQIVSEPVFPTLFRTHSGKNAMEEYLLAIDELQGAKFDLAYQQFRATGPDRSNSYLQSARKLVEVSGKCFDFIVAGNALPYVDPRTDMTMETIVRELPGLRAVGQVLAAKMSVELADGKQSAALNTFINGIRFSDKCGRKMLLSGLVSAAIQGVLLDRAYWLLPSLSIGQCQLTIKSAEQLLSGTDMMGEAMLTEAGPVIRSLEAAANDPSSQSWETINSEMDSSESESLKKATREERVALLKKAIPVCKAYYDQIGEELKKPESTWSVPPFKTNNVLVIEVAQMFTAVYEQIFSSTKRNRTRLRLLRLHAAIRMFRHENGSLPADLTVIAPHEWTLDPVTGGVFHYEVRPDRTYDLYSEGDSATGLIDLRGVRKSPVQDQKSPDDPVHLGAW